MTTANMKLIAVDVPFPDKLEKSAQKLEPGEDIVARIVELSKLSDELKGEYVSLCLAPSATHASGSCRVREEGSSSR